MAQEMDLQYCILRGASSERILEGATGSALRATCVSIQHWVEGNIPIISVPFPALSQSVPQKLQKKCDLESMVTNEEGIVGTPPRGEAGPLCRMGVQAKMSPGISRGEWYVNSEFRTHLVMSSMPSSIYPPPQDSTRLDQMLPRARSACHSDTSEGIDSCQRRRLFLAPWG